MAGKQESADAKRAARGERRRNQTRTEILDTARKVIFENGLGKFSLTRVAEELGLTKPALYYYFRSKEALIFDLMLHELMAAAQQVQAAVEPTETGGDAVEALMRTTFARYRSQLDLFRLVSMPGHAIDLEDLVGPGELERVRPINDMLYGGAEERLLADQRKKTFPKQRNPRRFAFTAHMAVHGLLNMKSITESSGDPLVHGDDELIDDICLTFRDAARGGLK